MEIKIAAIIPARYGSTRFPGKPLALLGGKPMIQHVYERAAKVLNDVFVATDDNRIFDTVVNFGGKAIMTSENHKSGTDRCYEAYSKIGSDFDVVINIQGDEPFIQPEQIEALCACFDADDTDIATLVKQFTPKDGIESLKNPNSPKVIFNQNYQALYFSRSVIPYLRGTDENDWLQKQAYYKHIGIYAYRSNVLADITKLSQSPLEIAESLEQLRWIENGYTIKVGITNAESIGIDTPEDLEKAEKFLREQQA